MSISSLVIASFKRRFYMTPYPSVAVDMQQDVFAIRIDLFRFHVAITYLASIYKHSFRYQIRHHFELSLFLLRVQQPISL